MPFSHKSVILLAVTIVAAGGLLFGSLGTAYAQTRLTYPEINTALQTKLPNQSFKNKSELMKWIILQVRNRKIDKPLTQDREDDLRQAGATEELIQVIRTNSPALPTPTPTPTPTPRTIVDLGDLTARALNLVKPEYTPEAERAGTTGQVKLGLELDEEGRVTSVARLSVLPNGLTDRAVEAARRSTFRPARMDGRPTLATGVLIYNFKLNLINVPVVFEAAENLRGKGQCDLAIDEYTKVINADSMNSRAFYGRGMCNLIVANYDAAAVDLDAASLADPSDAESLFFLAVANDFRGEPAAAGTYYGKALNLRPEYAKRPITECLYIERNQMTPEEAKSAAGNIINACDRALRGAPDYLASLIYEKRGIGYRLKGDYDRAITEFEAARQMNPQFTALQMQLHTTYNSRGLLAFSKKDYKAAFDDVSAAINLKPQSPTPYINRCVIYLYGWKQFDQAIDDCTTAIRLSTKSSMAYVHRGYAYELKGNLTAAITDYKKALDIEPRNQAAQTNLNRLQQPSIKNGRPY